MASRYAATAMLLTGTTEMSPTITAYPPTYELYGLCVRSEVALGAPVHHCASPALDVCWGDRFPIPDKPPAGCVLAKLSLSNGWGYSHTATPDGYTLRFHATCEFRVDHARRSIRVHLDPRMNPGIAPVLLAGNVAGFLLTLAGECVLHASAVEIGGAALAFVGGTGMGKSTLAALFCAGGARFITDDLLRLEPDGGGFICVPGPSEIRLRQGAAILAERFPAGVTRLMADQRVAIRLDNRSGARPRLHAIVIPNASRTAQALRLEQLTPLLALLGLARYPRVLGWRASESIRRQFLWLGRVARSVPVFEAEIPWGPPFSRELPTALLRGVDFDGRLAEVPA